jgi:hypothetical protein
VYPPLHRGRTNPDGFSSAIQFTTTYFNINVNDYGLKDNDLAVVLVARHLSTLFAYSDAIWAKYGKPISERNKVLDPKTNQPPTMNLQRERLEPLIERGLVSPSATSQAAAMPARLRWRWGSSRTTCSKR